MKKSLFALFLSLVMLSTGAQVARSDENPLPKPDVLTEEEVFISQKLSSYDTLVIREFTTDDAEYSNVDDEERPKIDAMKPLLTKNDFRKSCHGAEGKETVHQYRDQWRTKG